MIAKTTYTMSERKAKSFLLAHDYPLHRLKKSADDVTILFISDRLHYVLQYCPCIDKYKVDVVMEGGVQ